MLLGLWIKDSQVAEAQKFSPFSTRIPGHSYLAFSIKQLSAESEEMLRNLTALSPQRRRHTI